MADTTTFRQVIGNKTIVIKLPVTRVTKVIDKVDGLIDAGKLKQAEKLLAPFVVTGIKKGKEIVVMAASVASKGAKKEQALALIAKLQEHGRDRKQIIAQVQHDLEMSYANARHYVVNVTKVA